MLRRRRDREALRERYGAGIAGDLDDWLEFNRNHAFRRRGGLDLVAPFPPPDLMQNTTGLDRNELFAQQGAHFVRILSDVSPRPLTTYTDVLDFGVGVGRLARMFKGFPGRYTGVDVDARHVAWVQSALDHVEAIVTVPRAPLPFDDDSFDLVVSISVFTHMDEADQLLYLAELARVSRPGATVLLTVHGDRALERARTDASIFSLLDIPAAALGEASEALTEGGFRFVVQDGHLTSDGYQYGITFIGRAYIDRTWSRFFDVVEVHSGAIHDFQDVVVLRARSS